MKDKTIINIISKTYFAIVSFFIFIFSLLLIIFIILQNGLFIKNLSIFNIQAQQVYIKWNENIDVSVKEIHILKRENTKYNNYRIEYKNISTYLKSVSYTTKWFNSILINKIIAEDTISSFNYKKNEKGFFKLSSNTLDINISLSFDNSIVLASINSFKDKKRDVNINGSIYFDINDKNLYSNININIHNDTDLTLYAKSDSKKIQYKVLSKEKIKKIKHLIAILKLPKVINYWAYDAITMSNLDIQHVSGFIEYDDINNLYKNIHIKATINNLDYKYNTKLNAINTNLTELEFKNGVLYIRPINAYTYGMYLDKSWLKVDFTKAQELLSIHLLFDGMLNKDMLHILDTYKIKLPFLQNSGKISTDLTLRIGLQDISVNADGKFYTKEANFDYLGLNIDIKDSYIKLHNFDVKIDKMTVSYKNIAKATVKMKLDVQKSYGNIEFKFTKLNLLNADLNVSDKPLFVTYNVSPKQDTINVDKSKWIFQKRNININEMLLQFDLNKLLIHIPPTLVNVKPFGNAFVSGGVDLKRMEANIDSDILNFSYGSIKLTQSNALIKIKYDKKISLFSKDDIFFDISASEYKIKNFLIEIEEDDIYLKHTFVEIAKHIKTKIYAHHNFTSKKSNINLYDFIVKDEDNILYKNKKIPLSASMKDGMIKVKSSALDSEFSSNNNEWSLSISSINKISHNSQLLKKFHLTKGRVRFYKNKNEKFTRFFSTIKYPYKFLVEDNEPISTYKAKGRINKGVIYLNVNNNVNIKIADDIKIYMSNSGINVSEVIRAIKDINVTKDKNSTTNIILNAKNSYIQLGKTRKAISSHIGIQYYKNVLTAQLEYGKGTAGLKLSDKKFHLYGKGFNDKFMENLFSFSKFQGGNLDFTLDGSINEYKGLFYIKKTIMKDYKTLNNILAFVNTIPSLITFSLPGYNKNGLFVDNAYLNFSSKNNDLNISDIYLDSKEMDIFGHGVANIKKDTVDVVLNLKTDLGSNLSKVPLVGYVLFNEDTISTTLNINGKLSNPKVKSMIAQDIVIAPFNIIGRALLLPFKLIQDSIGDLNTSK